MEAKDVLKSEPTPMDKAQDDRFESNSDEAVGLYAIKNLSDPNNPTVKENSDVDTVRAIGTFPEDSIPQLYKQFSDSVDQVDNNPQFADFNPTKMMAGSINKARADVIDNINKRVQEVQFEAQVGTQNITQNEPWLNTTAPELLSFQDSMQQHYEMGTEDGEGVNPVRVIANTGWNITNSVANAMYHMGVGEKWFKPTLTKDDMVANIPELPDLFKPQNEAEKAAATILAGIIKYSAVRSLIPMAAIIPPIGSFAHMGINIISRYPGLMKVAPKVASILKSAAAAGLEGAFLSVPDNEVLGSLFSEHPEFADQIREVQNKVSDLVDKNTYPLDSIMKSDEYNSMLHNQRIENAVVSAFTVAAMDTATGGISAGVKAIKSLIKNRKLSPAEQLVADYVKHNAMKKTISSTVNSAKVHDLKGSTDKAKDLLAQIRKRQDTKMSSLIKKKSTESEIYNTVKDYNEGTKVLQKQLIEETNGATNKLMEYCARPDVDVALTMADRDVVDTIVHHAVDTSKINAKHSVILGKELGDAKTIGYKGKTGRMEIPQGETGGAFLVDEGQVTKPNVVTRLLTHTEEQAGNFRTQLEKEEGINVGDYLPKVASFDTKLEFARALARLSKMQNSGISLVMRALNENVPNNKQSVKSYLNRVMRSSMLTNANTWLKIMLDNAAIRFIRDSEDMMSSSVSKWIGAGIDKIPGLQKMTWQDIVKKYGKQIDAFKALRVNAVPDLKIRNVWAAIKMRVNDTMAILDGRAFDELKAAQAVDKRLTYNDVLKMRTGFRNIAASTKDVRPNDPYFSQFGASQNSDSPREMSRGLAMAKKVKRSVDKGLDATYKVMDSIDGLTEASMLNSEAIKEGIYTVDAYNKLPGNMQRHYNNIITDKINETTFRRDFDHNPAFTGYRKLLQGIDEVSLFPISQALDPFIRSTNNIAMWVLNRTPLFNAMSKEMRMAFRAGGRLRAEAISKTMMGLSIYSLGILGRKMGTITPSYTKNNQRINNKVRINEYMGKAPNSIVIGNKSFPLWAFQPIGTMLMMGAAIAHAHDMSLGNLDAETENDLIDHTILVSSTIGENIADEFPGANLAKAYHDVLSGKFSKVGYSVLGLAIPQMIPYGISVYKQMKGDDQQIVYANKIADKMLKKLGTGTRRYNTFGEPVQGNKRVGGFLPITYRNVQDDKVLQKLYTLGVNLPEPPTYLNTQWGKIYMTSDMYDDFNKNYIAKSGIRSGVDRELKDNMIANLIQSAQGGDDTGLKRLKRDINLAIRSRYEVAEKRFYLDNKEYFDSEAQERKSTRDVNRANAIVNN